MNKVMKTTIIVIAVILNSISLIYIAFKEFELLQRAGRGKKCKKLRNEAGDEVCSSHIWRKIMFDKYSYCKREECPGFAFVDNEKEYRVFSVWTFFEIILKQAPAIAVIVLLLKELF